MASIEQVKIVLALALRHTMAIVHLQISHGARNVAVSEPRLDHVGVPSSQQIVSTVSNDRSALSNRTSERAQASIQPSLPAGARGSRLSVQRPGRRDAI